MISLGSARWTSSNPKITLSFAYEKQRSGADMQYRAQITVSTVAGSSYFGYPIYLKLNIGGELRETRTLKKASPSQWSKVITYTSPWYTVPGKTTGTTPVSFNVYSGLGSSRSATYSYNMDVDPAASEISAQNGTLGTALDLSVTRYNESFTDTITYQCGSVSGTVKSGSTAATVRWDTSNGNVIALAAQNTSGPTVDVTFTLTTYSGGSPVGTTTAKVTMVIPDTVKPSVALKIEDAAGYYNTYGAYVQGYSKLKITAIPTLAHGSPIKTYAIAADGSSYSTSPVTTDALKGKGTQIVTATVTDERTRPSEPTSQSITVLEYAKPVVNLSAYRCNSSGAADPEGAYMRIVVTSTISSLNGKNSATYRAAYSAGEFTGNGNSFTSDVLPCDVSFTHNVEVTITDKLASTTKAAVIPIAYTLVDYHNSGKGISFGKVGTREGFDCAMQAYFTGGFSVEATTLTSADNLNNIKANGWYKWEWSNPPANAPSGDGTAYMRAMRVWSNGDECCQEVIDMTGSDYHGGMVRRTIYGSTAYPWEWVNPPLMEGIEYRTTERFIGKPVYTKVISFGALPNATSKSITHGISNMDALVSYCAYATAGSSRINLLGMRYIPDLRVTHSGVEVQTDDDMSGWTECYFNLKYTKTTE